MASYSLQGAVVIVTGAASGIGRALAIQAAQAHAYVIGIDINASELAVTDDLVKQQNNFVGMESHIVDVGNALDIQNFVAKVLPTLANRYLILINNAGVALHSGTFAETQLSDFEWLYNINFWGVVRLTKAFYPYFIAQNKGHIVNISSVFGLAGAALQVHYCSSKFGVRGFTESLRMELLHTNIRSLCVHPGGIKTNIARNVRLAKAKVTEEEKNETIAAFDAIARTSAESAAQQIIRAIEQGRERLVIGRDGRFLDYLVRCFPVRYTRWLFRQYAGHFKVLKV